MKRLLFTLIAGFCAFALSAQPNKNGTDTGKIYSRVSQSPSFPGGNELFNNYADKAIVNRLKANYKYGLVVAEILIEKNGKISRAKILQGLNAEDDTTAVILLKNSPPWRPGYNNGQPVRTLAQIGIRFRDPMFARIVRVPDVHLSPGHDADVVIDEPVGVPGPDTYDPTKIYTSVERVPQFPGGMVKFYEYINENLKNEKFTEEDQGKVIVSFVVERDGRLTGIKVVRSVSAAADAIALKILKKSPKWEPGTQNGHPVRVAYSVPVNTKPNN
ncbi:energy transducer TonB [Mucilaginibacter sp.]|uniref:energy transducer TonB n=1 Tax=Mucilaginibacter sp. TaxID=1882438 RepID=UPI0025ECCCC1|nr:energy transducer TonB [Mucilaginibacter sp.]